MTLMVYPAPKTMQLLLVAYNCALADVIWAKFRPSVASFLRSLDRLMTIRKTERHLANLRTKSQRVV